MSDERGSFSPKQVEFLLHSIKPNRVLNDGKGHSHVSQQDITAHLIRMFGFGNFDIEVLDRELLFESYEAKTNKAGKNYTAWDVAYRSLVRLTVRNEEGVRVAFYENGSVGSAQNQPSRADAHDLAYKSAISLSIKRAAIALGDQFGLSLYNKGQLTPLVIRTLVGLREDVVDIQADVPQQVSLGNDEIDTSDEQVVPSNAPDPTGNKAVEDITARIPKAATQDELMALWKEATEAGVQEEVRSVFTSRKMEIEG